MYSLFVYNFCANVFIFAFCDTSVRACFHVLISYSLLEMSSCYFLIPHMNRLFLGRCKQYFTVKPYLECNIKSK